MRALMLFVALDVRVRTVFLFPKDQRNCRHLADQRQPQLVSHALCVEKFQREFCRFDLANSLRLVWLTNGRHPQTGPWEVKRVFRKVCVAENTAFSAGD